MNYINNTCMRLKLKEAAIYLGISEWLLRKLCRERKIPFARLGSLYVFDVEILNTFLKHQQIKSTNFDTDEATGLKIIL